MRLPWRCRPTAIKPFKPCDQMCPHSVEQRVAEVGQQAPMLLLNFDPTQAELDGYKERVIGEMRRIAATLPPPCRRCPATLPHTEPSE